MEQQAVLATPAKRPVRYRTRLLPVHVPKVSKTVRQGKKGPYVAWVVDLRDEQRCRRRLFFKSQAEARAVALREHNKLILAGHRALSIPDSLRLDALWAADQLKHTGPTLREVVTEYLARQPKKRAITFAAAADAYIASRQDASCKVSSLNAMKCLFALAAWGEILDRKGARAPRNTPITQRREGRTGDGLGRSNERIRVGLVVHAFFVDRQKPTARKIEILRQLDCPGAGPVILDKRLRHVGRTIAHIVT